MPEDRQFYYDIAGFAFALSFIPMTIIFFAAGV